MLDFVYVDKIDAELENVELIVEAEPHNTNSCINIALSFQVLLGKVLEVIAAHLQLQMLHIVVN